MPDQIKDNIEKIAAEDGLEIEFVRKRRDFRKEQRIKELLAQRGDHPGMVHIFSAMEACTAFKPWWNIATVPLITKRPPCGRRSTACPAWPS